MDCARSTRRRTRVTLIREFFDRNGADYDAFLKEAAEEYTPAKRPRPAPAEPPPASVQEMAARAAARDREREQRQETVRGTLLDGLRMTEDEYTTMLEGAHR
jgi:hypothetical protein